MFNQHSLKLLQQTMRANPPEKQARVVEHLKDDTERMRGEMDTLMSGHMHLAHAHGLSIRS